MPGHIEYGHPLWEKIRAQGGFEGVSGTLHQSNIENTKRGHGKTREERNVTVNLLRKWRKDAEVDSE